MFKRSDIMRQALEDNKSIKNILPKGISVIGRGVKIQEFDDGIQILNMGKGGDYFKECSDEEYDHGVTCGECVVDGRQCGVWDCFVLLRAI